MCRAKECLAAMASSKSCTVRKASNCGATASTSVTFRERCHWASDVREAHWMVLEDPPIPIETPAAPLHLHYATQVLCTILAWRNVVMASFDIR